MALPSPGKERLNVDPRVVYDQSTRCVRRRRCDYQPVSVIDAIGSGRQAAAGIDAYLRGVPAEEIPVSSREVPIARRKLLPEELVPMPRHASSTIPMAQRMHSYPRWSWVTTPRRP